MATLLQKELAKNIVENARAKKKKNKKELVVSGGYSLTVAEAKPQFIISQKGVQEELENLGFTEEGAKRVVQEILYDKRVKPDTRINAAKEVFKVEGSYAPEKHLNLNIPVPIYGGKSIASVQGHKGDAKDIQSHKENKSG